jgi:hypothetical protein
VRLNFYQPCADKKIASRTNPASPSAAPPQSSFSGTRMAADGGFTSELCFVSLYCFKALFAGQYLPSRSAFLNKKSYKHLLVPEVYSFHPAWRLSFLSLSVAF